MKEERKKRKAEERKERRVDERNKGWKKGRKKERD
jgi:hypothetical protein